MRLSSTLNVKITFCDGKAVIRIASCLLQSCRGGEDRISVTNHSQVATLVLADGMGGAAGGGSAAEYAVRELGQLQSTDASSVLDAIYRVDAELLQDPALGETTVIAVVIDDSDIVGAAVGDSEIFSLSNGALHNLAPYKDKKPLLGSGRCIPAILSGTVSGSRLFMCSDGITNYVKSGDLVDCLFDSSLDNALDRLVARVKLPNGTLQDDVSMILVEG